MESKVKYKKILPLKSGTKIYFVKISEIKYILASRYYSEVHTLDKAYVVRKPLGEILSIVEVDCFIRIHRSTIVNKDFVKELYNSGHGEIDVIMEDKSVFRVGTTYKDHFLDNIGLI